MLEYTEIHVPFKDLFTDINKDEYRQIFSKGEINDIKLNTSIPMQLFKKEALPTELYDRTEDLPVYIIINAGVLVDSIVNYPSLKEGACVGSQLLKQVKRLY